MKNYTNLLMLTLIILSSCSKETLPIQCEGNGIQSTDLPLLSKTWYSQESDNILSIEIGNPSFIEGNFFDDSSKNLIINIEDDEWTLSTINTQICIIKEFNWNDGSPYIVVWNIVSQQCETYM